jgi:hypothetical protein
VQQNAVQQKAVQQKSVRTSVQKEVKQGVQKGVRQQEERQKGVRQQEEPEEDHQAVHQEHQTEQQQAVHQAEQYTEKQAVLHEREQDGVQQEAERQQEVQYVEIQAERQLYKEDQQAVHRRVQETVHQEHQTERQQGVQLFEQYTEKQMERKLHQAVQQQGVHQQGVQQQDVQQQAVYQAVHKAVHHLRQRAQETNQLQLEQQGEKQVSTVQMSNSQRYSFCTIKSEILTSNSNTIIQNIWMKYDHFPHCSDKLREETVDLSAKSPLWHPRHSSHPKSPQPYVSFAIVSDQFNGCNKTKGPTFKIAMPMYYSERYVRQTLKALLEKTTGIIGSVCIIASTIVYECICCAYILFNRMGWLHCDRRVGS